MHAEHTLKAVNRFDVQLVNSQTRPLLLKGCSDSPHLSSKKSQGVRQLTRAELAYVAAQRPYHSLKVLHPWQHGSVHINDR